MDATKLRHFLAVAEQGHFGRAAESLGLSQQALSKSVAALERSLRVRLFERGQFGAALTSYGEALLRRAKVIDAELKLGRAEIDALRGSREGHVRVGVGLSFVGRIMPAAIVRMRRMHPGVTITGVVESSAALFPMLLHGELDFVASAPPTSLAVDPELAQEKLFADRDHVVVRAQHPLAKRRRVGLEDLREYPWLMSAQLTAVWSRVCRVFTANGLEPPRSLVRSDSIGLAKALLPLEDFIALLSPESVDVELAQSTLVALEAPQVAEQRVAAITTRARSSLQPAARELIALVREECMRLYGPP